MEHEQHPDYIVGTMGIGQVLDTGIGLARRHYGLLVGITAWGIVPTYVVATLLSLLLPGRSSDIVGGLITNIGTILASAALAFAVARLIESSDVSSEPTPRALYRAAGGRFWSIYGNGIVVGAAAIPLVILLPLGIYVFGRWAVAWVALVIDNYGSIEALKRSWALTRGVWWHTFVIALAALLLVAIMQIVVGGIFVAAAGAARLVLDREALSNVIGQIGTALVTVLIEPFSVAMFVVLYYELRARGEGFDLTQRARQTLGND